MRTFLILGMFTASLAHAAWRDYEETRNLTLDADGIDIVVIEAGAGSLEVRGIANARSVSVTAHILVPAKEEKAKKVIESDMVLKLERDGDSAVLHGYFEHDGWNWGDSPSIRLDVEVPGTVGLDIEDGSGSIKVWDVSGDIEIDDGSGSLQMSNVGGDIEIEDGSGSVTIEGVGGDISIDDGSGSITIRDVRGSVVVDDGSGGITVTDVDANLTIVDDGSGGLTFARIEGRVEKAD